MNAALGLGAALLGAAAAALVPSPAATLPRRPSQPATRTPGSARRRAGVLLAAALAGAVALSGLHGRHVALCAVLLVCGAGVLRIMERSRTERAAQRRRDRAIDFCEALVGELRAGQPTARALERSARPWTEARRVVAAARVDASVPSALRDLAELPGAGCIRRLAAAWEISVGTGSGLVVAVERVLATARAEDVTARLVRAELASARATARLVTALPVVVLLAAHGVGARPWHFLLDTAPGVGCLAAGAGLALAGLGWIDRIAARSLDGGG
jgi:tight adherence protein B